MITQKSLSTILITSPALGEGKTTIAINLAAAFAQAGQRVILVDTDFHRPTLHSQLGLSNEAGLTDILEGKVKWCEVAIDCNGVRIITSGAVLPRSYLMLESVNMVQLLDELQHNADIVILDGPPLFVVDSKILASKVNGVLLVIRQGNTIAQVARAMLDQLRQKESNVIGVVLNRVKHPDSYYYYDGYYREGVPSGKNGKS